MTGFEFQINEKFHRHRLDEFLFNEFRSMSKAYLRRIVKEGCCEVNGYVGNSGNILRRNDFIEISVDIDYEKGMKPEMSPLDIVYEDDEIIVVNKAAGILVHPTNYERNGTLLSGLTWYLNRDKPPEENFIRPHLIHRLDRATSGLMVAAAKTRASRVLCSHFKRRLFEKRYTALVDGIVFDDEGVVKAPIGRYEELRRWGIKDNGKPSETRFRVIARLDDKTLLSLEPVTGRTNQLRIHCAFIGHPVVGDDRYGGSLFERLCLHASKLGFWHPDGKRSWSLSAIFPLVSSSFELTRNARNVCRGRSCACPCEPNGEKRYDLAMKKQVSQDWKIRRTSVRLRTF